MKILYRLLSFNNYSALHSYDTKGQFLHYATIIAIMQNIISKEELPILFLHQQIEQSIK